MRKSTSPQSSSPHRSRVLLLMALCALFAGRPVGPDASGSLAAVQTVPTVAEFLSTLSVLARSRQRSPAALTKLLSTICQTNADWRQERALAAIRAGFGTATSSA